MKFPALFVASLFSLVAATPLRSDDTTVLSPRAGISATSTFYPGNLHGGTCSFSTYTLPSGIYGTALAVGNWDNAAHCGACVSVTGPNGKTITAMIVDQCATCTNNNLDLFESAFSVLSPLIVGIIPITWSYVKCPISAPLQLHNKDGVSIWWFSMQVVGANQPVGKLEVSTDGGKTWQGTQRQSYNFFQASSGFGKDIVDVKVTSADGSGVVIVKEVKVASGTSVTASGNF